MLISSIVDVVDDPQVDLSVGETDIMVSVEADERTWEGLGCDLLESCEGLRTLSLKSSKVEGLRSGDVLKTICGSSVNEMAATLDSEFVEQNPLDALTKRAQFALQTGPVVSLVVSRKSLFRLARRHVAEERGRQGRIHPGARQRARRRRRRLTATAAAARGAAVR